MTPEKYLELCDKLDRTYHEAWDMDQHIKTETPKKVKAWLMENLGKKDGEFFTQLIRMHDEFCTQHKFYPDYMR